MSQEFFSAQSQQPAQWNVWDLAQQASGVQAASLVARYDTLHDQLNSALVADTVITIDRDTAIRQQNMRLLNAFRGILPAIGIESDSQKMPRHVFTVEDMMTARMIQANTIWVKQDVVGFIIGEAPNPDPYYKHGTRFLCLPPVPVTGLHAVDTQRKKTATNLADIRKELHEATITEAAVAAIYDRKENKFKVGSSPIHLCTLLHIWESASLGHVRDYGMHARIKSNGENLLEFGPSNQEMASYDIFGNLGRLATIFGVSEKYQAILEKQGQVERAMAAIERVEEPSNEELYR